MKRRTFLRTIAPALALPFTFHGFRFNALARPMLSGMPGLADDESDRVLVIVQMEGGNDGLNTVIPIEDDLYYKARPTIAIPKQQALRLHGTNLLALHPGLEGMQHMYDNGRLAIVTNIGYNDYSLSHFTGTEIWNTGSGTAAADMRSTGWIGRYLHGQYPDYPEVLPEDPPAIQIRPSTSSAFNIHNATIGVALTDPIAFHELVNGVPALADDPTLETAAAEEWRYIRGIEAQAVGFSQSIRAAALKASNAVVYPTDNHLAEALAIVARLIAGGLRTRVYMVNIGNFDTHGNQLQHQGWLLGLLGPALKAFDEDIQALGIDRRVVGMTYSEFGRRIFENASGTDHGAAAPHFVFGSAIDGGRVFGRLPDLANPDTHGNLAHDITFQCYYASVLGPLFGLSEQRMQEVLPVGLCSPQERIPLFRASPIGTPPPSPLPASELQAMPNPATDHTILRFMLAAPGTIRLRLYSAEGRLVRTLVDAPIQNGNHALHVDLAGLPSGAYHFLLECEGTSRRARVVVRR